MSGDGLSNGTKTAEPTPDSPCDGVDDTDSSSSLEGSVELLDAKEDDRQNLLNGGWVVEVERTGMLLIMRGWNFPVLAKMT